MADFSSPFNSPDREPPTDIRDLLGLKVPDFSPRAQVAADIRKSLEAHVTEDVLEIIQDPAFRPMIIDSFKMSISPSAQMLEKQLEPLEEGEEWRRGADTEEAATERMDAQIDDLFESPELLERMAKTHASARYLGPAEIEKMYDMMKNLLAANEANPKLVAAVEEKHAAVMGEAGRYFRIMDILIDRALAEGIESASTRDAEMEAIRAVFPTADDYREYFQKSTEHGEEYNLALARAFGSADTEQGKFISSLLGGMSRGKGIMEMMGCEIQKDLLERDVARIYGS